MPVSSMRWVSVFEGVRTPLDTYLIIISLRFTFAEPFDDIFLFVKSSCALVSGNTNKSLRPKTGTTERTTKGVNSRNPSHFRSHHFFAHSRLLHSPACSLACFYLSGPPRLEKERIRLLRGLSNLYCYSQTQPHGLLSNVISCDWERDSSINLSLPLEIF